jgi:hypothetical protein
LVADALHPDQRQYCTIKFNGQDWTAAFPGLPRARYRTGKGIYDEAVVLGVVKEPHHWRLRAEQTRASLARADPTRRDLNEKRSLLRIAEEYDRLRPEDRAVANRRTKILKFECPTRGGKRPRFSFRLRPLVGQ